MRTALLLLGLATVAAAADPERTALPVERPGIGRRVELERVRDLDGAEHAIAGPVVVAMTSPACPLSRKYARALGRLGAEAKVVYVDVHGADTAEEFRAFAGSNGFRGVLVHDPERKVARALGATTTTELFLLDATRTLLYRGALDDQYGIGSVRAEPSRRYLADALAAVADGLPPPVRSTSAPGCALGLDEDPALESEITWHGTVQRIVQRNCVECHRDGGVGPFPLENYKQVSAAAEMIRFVLEKKIMPPWFAADSERGRWANDRSLPERDRADLLAWLATERPRGDPAAAPAPTKWRRGWSIGKPDALFELPDEVEVPAEGKMPYVHRMVETSFEEDKWVRAWEVAPTAPDVVHHVIVFIVPTGQRRPSRADAGFFAAFVPGNSRAIYPSGLAKRLPKGATLYFQMHYTPSGTARRDRTQLAVRFTDRPRHEVRTAGIANVGLHIPAGAVHHESRASIPVPFDVEVLTLMPHMHYRGKAFRFELARGDQRETLLDVPRYDFNWQLSYRFAQPRAIAAGSRIHVTGWFDNSADNPANPDPTRDVYWGLQTEDEMLLGYVEYYPTAAGADPGPLRVLRTRADRLLGRYDRDRNGRLSRRECPPNMLVEFGRLDRNQDGEIDRDELNAVRERRR